LAAVMILAKPGGQTPVAVFAGGIGTFVTGVVGPLVKPLGMEATTVQAAFTTFGLLAVSTFLLTTLDTCTRLARFIVQELFNIRGTGARLFGTGISLLFPAFLVFQDLEVGGKIVPAWKAIWPAFGASNQLLAALALLVVYAWLRSEGKKTVYVLIPMIFMCATTLTALALLAYNSFMLNQTSVYVGGISVVLFFMATGVIIDTVLHLRKR
jgi:carbon starvation protein